MNDICTAVSDNINLFADDTSLYVTDQSAALLPDTLQRAIDGVSTWFSTWLLSVNTLKSAVMVLRSAKMPPVPLDVSIDGQMLPQVSTLHHLGLVVDENLTWSAHVQSVTAKVSQRLGLLWRLRNRLSGLVLRELYTTCIRPVIEHSSVVWSSISSTDSEVRAA